MSDLHDKLERIIDRLGGIDVTLARQEENLREHMRRTDLAERAIEGVRSELKPVKDHVARVDGVLKGLGVLAVIVTIIGGVMKIIGG